jgi:hypothetical protein
MSDEAGSGNLKAYAAGSTGVARAGGLDDVRVVFAGEGRDSRWEELDVAQRGGDGIGSSGRIGREDSRCSQTVQYGRGRRLEEYPDVAGEESVGDGDCTGE